MPSSLLLESNVLPPIPFELDGEEGEPSAILTAIKPKMTGSHPLLGRVTYAPYGEPTEGLGGLVFTTITALALYGAWRLFRG